MQIDPLQAVTLFFVAWTVLAIFVYSIGYHNYGQPKGDIDQAGLPPRGATVSDDHGHALGTHEAISVRWNFASHGRSLAQAQGEPVV